MPNKQQISGLEIMASETALVENRTKKACQYAFSEIGNTPKGISVYLYGSPGRKEMIGGDGDADVFILEKERTAEGRRFRELFGQKMEEFDYAKLDLPEWGTISEAETFMEKSLVEGNQVFETRFVWGDKEVNAELEKLKSKYNSPERAIKNFIFNRLYLDEYFRRKTRDGALNVKYCAGGSRDILFLSWYKDVIDLSNKVQPSEPDGPKCFEGAKIALQRGIISIGEYSKLVASIDYLTTLRTEILAANKGSEDRGLSFLDLKTIQKIRAKNQTPTKIREEFEKNRTTIRGIVDAIYSDVLTIGRDVYSNSWGENIRRIKEGEVTPQEILAQNDNPVIAMGRLWVANNLGMKDCFLELAKRYSDTADWAIIGTIVNSTFCPSELLDTFGRGIGKERGYGYLLRVIARNPNTPPSTLKSIAEDTSLEDRYTSIARAALIGGIEATKKQL